MARLARLPWWTVPLGIFLATRVSSAILLVVVGHDQISAAQLPAGMPIPTIQDPASYSHLVANWDGQWYRQITLHGYPSTLPTRSGAVQQNAWAFYPLYPAVVRLVMVTGLPFGVAATSVSSVAGALAMCLLYRMILRRSDSLTAVLSVLCLCSSPATLIFQAAYTESLSLLLLLLALLALESRRHGLFTAMGILLALTRAIAPPLALVAFVVHRLRRRSPEATSRAEQGRLLAGIAVVALSTLVWPVTAGVVTGDPRATLKTQASWYSRPSVVLLTDHGRQAVGVVVLIACLAVVCWRARVWPLSLRLWPVPYAVYILAATPPTASLLRYALLAGPVWWPFPGWSGKPRSHGSKVVLISAIVVIGLALQWWWMRTYFVVDPYSRGHP